MLSERIESVISFIEKNDNRPLSRLKVGVLSNSALTEISKLQIVYVDGNGEDGIMVDEAIYKTKSDFYIYIKNNQSNMLIEGIIMFYPEQLEEVKFTIIRLKKIK
jgi:hypothetical protein